MASDENVDDYSCIFDPNFAIVCSFFEKFSTLCGIQPPSFSMLQRMLEDTEEIAPQLIDLHIRLMRKARKNVTPDRWQRTLARFCYHYQPDDCWILEQKGYNHLDYAQRLRILLTLIGAQFDHNVKFKSDVNKLNVKDLRLEPFGKDKDGNKYWVHMDSELTLKVYKENVDDEKWELVAKDREDIKKLIEELMKGKDPNRQLEVVEDDEQSETENEENENEDLKYENDAAQFKEVEEGNVETAQNKSNTLQRKDNLLEEKDTLQKKESLVPKEEVDQAEKKSIDKTPKKSKDSLSSKPSITEQKYMNPCLTRESKNPDLIQIAVSKSNISDRRSNAVDQSSFELKRKDNDFEPNSKIINRESSSKITEVQKQSEELGIQKITPLKNTSSTPFLAHLLKPKAKTVHTPIKPLDKEKFAEHLQKLDSENMLMPLLSSSAIDEETVTSSLTDTLKSRISLKLNTIKPVLQTGLVKSKLESIGKTAKPGLKLEQILKSKLAQKLAVSSTSEVKINSENEDLAKLKESEGAIINSAVASQNAGSSECEPTDLSNKCYTNVVTTREKENSVEVTKRKIEDTDIPETKRARRKLDESEEEIEEPMMLVTGVGSGKDCNTGNETEENADKNSRPSHLTYNVDDILKSSAESDQNTEIPSTSGDAAPILDLVEKKKPKLWTIDAICSSDSSKETKRDDVSLFPNYSFNKDSKMDNPLPYRSFFGLSDTKDDKDRDTHSIMPTNFYFGCNNQNPCFLPLEKNVNSFKPSKSHNVKDIVEDLDKADSNYQSEDAKMVSHFSAENLCSSVKSSSLIHLSGREDSKLENNKSLAEKDLLTNDEITPCLEQESEQSSSNQLENSTAEMNAVNEMFNKVNQETIPNLKETIAEINGVNSTEQATISLVSQDTENVSFDTSKSHGPEDDTIEDNSLVDVNCNQRELPTITDLNPSDSQVSDMSYTDDFSKTSKKGATDTIIVDNNSETIEKIEPTETDVAVKEPQIIDLNTTITTTVIDTVSQIPYGNVTTTTATQFRLVEEQQPEIKVENGSQPTLSKVVNATVTEDSAVETEIEPTSKAPVTDNFNSAEPSPEKSSVNAITCSESGTPNLKNIKSEITEITDVCETPKLDAEDTESTETTDAKYPNYENDKIKDSLVPVSQKEQSPETVSECEFTKGDVDDIAAVECSNEIIEKKKKDKKSDVTSVTIRQSSRVTRGQVTKQIPTPEKSDVKTSKKGKVKDDEDEKEDSEVLDSKKSIRKGKPKDEAIVEEQKDEIKEEKLEIVEMKKSRLQKNLPKEGSSEKEKTEVVETRKITRKKKTKEEVNEKDETEMPEAKQTPNRKGKQKKEEGKNGKESEITEPKRTSLRISKKEEQCIKEETENLEYRKLQRKGKQKKDTEELENEDETIVKRRKNKKSSTSQKNMEYSEHEDEVTTKKRKNKKNDAPKKDVADESEHEVEATVKRKYCKKADITYSNGSNIRKKKAKHLKSETSVVNEDENVKDEPTVPTLKLKLKKGRPRVNKEENWEDVTNEKKTKSMKVESFTQEKDEQEGSDGFGQSTSSTKKVTKGKRKKAEKIRTAKTKKKNKECSTENKCEDEISTIDQSTSDAKPLENDSEEDEILGKRIEKLKKISDEKVEEEEEQKKKKKTLKRGWMNEVDINNVTRVTGPESSGIRQSRRIAQLKIKEQAETGKYVDTVTVSKKSSLSNQKSKMATPTKKLNKFAKKSSKYKLSKEESDEELYFEKSSVKKKKKKKDEKPKKNFDPHKAWRGKQSSDSSSEEEEEEDHFDEEDDDIAIFDASDHEFSPESGIDDDEDYQPVKRARTAYSKPRTEDKPERDDLSCQRCGTAEQPEWILLCDVCDEGWHAACLKPPMLAIPEGDWFCPPCEHNKLITNLQKFLKTYDKALNKKTNEELRRKRLEYVDISFSNIIVDQPIKKGERSQTNKVMESENSASSSDEESEEEEEEEEPLYQLRVRRQMNVSHRLNEYEELMSSAIERDVNDGIFPKASAALHSSVSTPVAPELLDTSLVSTVATEEATADKDQEKNESIIDEESKEEVKKVAPVVLQLRNIRKKPPRLTNLDVSSEDDHYSDEDFKGSSAEELEDDDEYEKSESDSDDRAPVRRSTRARVTRYDNDFINDDSDEDDEQDNRSNRNKKKRAMYSESDSEEEDSTWGKRKRNKHSQSHRPAKKRRKRIQFDSDSDNDRKKKPKKTSRVTYGLDESDDNLSQRRTRGKKINYLENLGSDSEEETTSRTNNRFRKILSDDDDGDYVDEEEQKQNTEDNVPHKTVESINDVETCPEQVNLKGLTSDSAESVTIKSPMKIVTNELNLTLEKPICNNSSLIKITDKSPEQTKNVSNGNFEFNECQTNNIKSDDFEGKKTNSQNISKMDVPVYSGVVETDNKPLLKKIDTNPSLQGMQSMTQNLSQTTASNPFPPASVPQDPKYSALISGSSGPVPINYADVGITYEDPEGASISPDDKYTLPIRVVSPSKLYSIQEGSPINRPSLPPFALGSQIQEPPMHSLQGSIGILPTNANRPMPTAIPIRGTRPISGTPATVSSHALPPSSVNVSHCGPPSMSEASPKRRPRGRGKKQLEMERLQRERESMDINRTGDEMMPLHLLKVSPSEMNAVRPPLSFSSPSGQPPPPPFNNYQRIPFSQTPPSSSQQQPSTCVSISTGNSSKRVKITPVRMRMPNTSQNIMRFSRSPGSTSIYSSAHHSVDSSLSPTAGQDTAGDGKVTPATSVSGSPVVSTVPVKSEPHMSHVGMKGGDCPPSEQYYLQPPFPPSQILRGYNARHEFPYSRKTVPNMYQQPHISSASPTSGAVVTSRASGFVNSKLPTVSSPNIKTEGSMTTVIKSPPVGPRPYSLPSHVPPSTSSVPTTTKLSQNAPYVSSPSSSQSHSEAQGPPTSTPPSSAYQMLHMKSPQSSGSTSLPYAPPYYTSSVMQGSYPVPSSQPSSISFSHSAPSNNYSNQLVGRAPIPQSSYKPEALSSSPVPVGSSSECITATSSSGEYLTPTSQSNDFQYSENQQTVVAPSESDNSIEYDGSSFNESSTTYNEESQPAEETSTGEFGGLVSYFSSQREDDLDT